MRWALFLAVLLAAAAAPAQKTVTPPVGLAEPPLAPPPGGIAVAGERMAISPAACATLSVLASAPDADYVPGVDARGNPVTPADLPGATGGDPAIPIEIGLDLRRRFGITARSPLLRVKSGVGLITVRDGRALVNGLPLADNERDLLLAACREARGRPP
jgi:hypothetical protein